MKRQYLTKHAMPDAPGVYTFRDRQKRPLYIGRATSLRDRVKSYFTNDLIDTRGPRIVDMVTKAVSLTWEEADSVLEAIILESSLIKRYQPFYNVDERDDKSALYVIITDEPWPRVFLERARDFDQHRKDGFIGYEVLKCFGPFIETGLIKEALKILRRLFPFRDKKAHDPRHEAFYQAIGVSPGREGEEARERYLRTIDHLVLFFQGKKSKLRTEIRKEMDEAAAEMRFEDASRSKKLLYALDHINDISLIKRSNANSARSGDHARTFRVEAYDVAHLSGTHVVGAMTVVENGQSVPAEYRKFKLRIDANNDLAGLIEILSRRVNHPEWTFPDLIVVDGNEMHVKAAESVLSARRISIPVAAVTKDDRHKAAKILGNPEIVKRYKDDIIRANSEAHRFAITYHRLRRRL